MKTSAGLLMFRKRKGELEVLLVHPGGPFFRNKDEGAWTIPKGEAAEGDDMLARARIAYEDDLPENFKHTSNTFEMEWPPRSGQTARFPEMDRAEFFSIEEAKRKIN